MSALYEPTLVRWKINTAVPIPSGSARRVPGDEEILPRRNAESLRRTGFVSIVGPADQHVPCFEELAEEDDGP